MRTLLRRRPSPAMIVACTALLVALTGTSVAAVSALAPGSVGTVQLKAGAVTRAKLRNNAVSSTKVARGSLLRSDFAPGQLPAGPTGPQGPAGPPGPAGAAGLAGTIGAVTVRQAPVLVPAPLVGQLTPTRGATVNCNAGEKAISAGTGWSGDSDNLDLATVFLKPTIGSNGTVTGYTAKGLNKDDEAHTFTLYVLCYT
jgi:hypothetical protein